MMAFSTARAVRATMRASVRLAHGAPRALAALHADLAPARDPRRPNQRRDLSATTAGDATPPSYDFDTLVDVNHLGLPRLPLPPLEDTVARYLETLPPVARSDAELDAAFDAAAAFVAPGGDGPELDALLRARCEPAADASGNNEARHDSAEDFSRLDALLFTAMAWIFIPAYCFAVP